MSAGSRAPDLYAPRLLGILRLSFELEVVTGLLIQMPPQAQTAHIGGADLYPMVTRRVYTIDGGEVELEVPYIPGSSLKGRMRSLLEQALGKKLYTTDRKIWMHVRNTDERPITDKRRIMTIDEFEEDVKSRCEVDDVFGAMSIHFEKLYNIYFEKLKREEGRDESAAKAEAERRALELFKILAPTRLLVEDLFPSDEYVRKLYEVKGGFIGITDFLEDKSENRIDRVTAAADPRDVVRVRPGVVFAGMMKLQVFDRDCEKVEEARAVERYIRALYTAMRLVEETYLGRGGSRGYGRVKFRNIRVEILAVKRGDGGGLTLEPVELEDGKTSLEYQTLASLDPGSLARLVVEKLCPSG